MEEMDKNMDEIDKNMDEKKDENIFEINEKSKKEEWMQRLTALEQQIEYWTKPENQTNKIIEIVQLFYDI